MGSTDKLYTRRSFPGRASIRTCTVCGHVELLKSPRLPGRGFGMREGNKARGRMIQHINKNHPEEVILAKQFKGTAPMTKNELLKLMKEKNNG